MQGAAASYGSAGAVSGKAPIRGTTVWFTAGAIVGDIMGAGIFSMAAAVSKLGWLLGTVALVAMIAMNAHISLLLWRVHMRFPEARTLGHLTHCSFEGATGWKQSLVRKVLEMTQSVAMFPQLGLYMLAMGKALGMLKHDFQLCLPTWTLVAALVLYPIASSGRKVGSYQSLVHLNVVSLVITIFIPFAHMISQGVEATRPTWSSMRPVAEDLHGAGVMTSLGTLFFATTGQSIIVEIMGEMRDVSEFPKAYVNISLPIQMALFLVVGVGGYYYKGSAIRDAILVDLIPFSFSLRIAAAVLFLHMVVSYIIKNTIFCRIVQRALQETLGGAGIAEGGRDNWAVIVGVVLAFAYLLAQIVPFFSDFVDLMGSTMLPFTCWIGPLLMSLQVGEVQWRRSVWSAVELLLAMFYIVLALTVIVFGTSSACQNIWAKWDTYGGPFSCHCENMWSDCKCSAFHLGMETCLAPGAHPGSV